MTAGERRRRLEQLAMFARHARVEDPRHEVPDPAFFTSPRIARRIPFILDAEQIRAIVCAARQLPSWKGLRGATYATIFGLLAATGMRPGEALAPADPGLRRWWPDDPEHEVSQEPLDPVAPIDRHCTRSIPRSPHALPTATDHVFVSERREPYDHGGPWKVFGTICRELGIVRSDGPPRLYDLRHSFAARALERCRGDRFAVREHMVSLMTYLGHACIVSTYWYLHATPELMTAIALTTERHFRGGLS
jgi:integrase